MNRILLIPMILALFASGIKAQNYNPKFDKAPDYGIPETLLRIALYGASILAKVRPAMMHAITLTQRVMMVGILDILKPRIMQVKL